MITGYVTDVHLLEFVLQELPALIDASDLHAAQVILSNANEYKLN